MLVPTYTQAVRPLRVTTPLGTDALLLVGLSGHEAISHLFQFHLDLLAENETAVPFETLLGQKVIVELGFPDQDVRYFGGICRRIGQAGRDQTFTAYHLEVVPQFWFLTRIAQSRIFQQLPVPEILGQVLKGLDVQFQLTGQYEPRDYCVQYRETDFNFASRLMEEEGIFYFFRHSARGHTLIIADSPQSFPELPEPLLFDEAFTSGNRDEERIGSWEKAQELRSGKVTLWDHCFELPHKHLEADKTIQDSVAAGSVTHKLKIDGSDKLELYDYPGEYAQRFDGVNPGGGDRPADLQKIFTDNQRTVELRMQEEAAAGLVIRGSGNVRALTSGSRFTLQRHYDADGSYLLTGVEHTARLTADYRSGDPDPYHYASSFSCLPAALPFRPARGSSRPFVQGTQTAVVVGPPGEEIFPDKYGRVKVQFHWDRQGKYDASSSCWVRVGTLWAGRNWGMVHIPRIGQEVIVAFEEGDPDRPIIVGSVYNADMMPPYGLPDNKTQSGVKSRSSLAGTPANFNEIRFEDKKGAEEVYIHAERDHNQITEHDRTEDVGHDRSLKVGHDKSEEVGHDKFIRVKNDETTFVDGNRREAVQKDETIKIGGNRSETVVKDEKIVIEQNRATMIQKDESLTVGGNRTQSIEKDDNLTVHKNRNIGITQNCGIIVEKNYTLKVNESIIIESDKDILLKCGGASILLTKDGKIQLEGSSLSVKGSGPISIKGQKVAVN
jgi:type VI secretion system secreted protein VgrG